jgi:4-hydroxy-3-polyprenylbenzoate decarboxylase
MTEAARQTASYELPTACQTDEQLMGQFSEAIRPMVRIHSSLSASIASGTYPTRGMIIAPCSMTTLAAIGVGLCDTLVRRAAHVTMKEGRKLLLVPREMPLTPIHLDHMLQLSRLGVVIMPPQPAWYLKPSTIEDVEDYIVARLLDRFGLPSSLQRWQEVQPFRSC